jgi:hypothetical protein
MLIRKARELASRLWRGEVGLTESVLLMGLVALAVFAAMKGFGAVSTACRTAAAKLTGR